MKVTQSTATPTRVKLWRNQWIFGTLLPFCLLATAQASVVTSLVGDKDGFGLPGIPPGSMPAVPPNNTANNSLWHTTYGGVYNTDYRSAADVTGAPFTDIWAVRPGGSTITYEHDYLYSGGAMSAVLSIQEAGMANGVGPWNVMFNGTKIGQIGVFTANVANLEAIQLLQWNVPVGLLTGADTISLVNPDVASDGFAINYSELSVVVPEPATIVTNGLVLLGIAGSYLYRRQRAKA